MLRTTEVGRHRPPDSPTEGDVMTQLRSCNNALLRLDRGLGKAIAGANLAEFHWEPQEKQAATRGVACCIQTRLVKMWILPGAAPWRVGGAHSNPRALVCSSPVARLGRMLSVDTLWLAFRFALAVLWLRAMVMRWRTDLRDFRAPSSPGARLAIGVLWGFTALVLAWLVSVGWALFGSFDAG